jgi:hypothetical protein
MIKASSPIYSIPQAEAGSRMAERIQSGCRRSPNWPRIFFRADDIGIPSRHFTQLIRCFQKHALPLCLATVPAWLSESRLNDLRRVTGTGTSQWCWHQHGRVHRNFEKTGKKQEFGPARPPEVIRNSIAAGRTRLEQLLGEDFLPVFTPPWNRCSGITIKALSDLGFQAVSRNLGAEPRTLPNLPDFQVRVDLHTRKEPSPQFSFDKLLNEIEEGLASGFCGIMIHHQRMNDRALELLDLLLEKINSHGKMTPVHFGDILQKRL